MIVFPIQLQMNENTLGTCADVALALFCAEFSYLNFTKVEREMELRRLKILGLHSVILKVNTKDILQNGKKNLSTLKILDESIRYCCEIRLFCILEIELDYIDGFFVDSISNIIMTLSKPYFHFVGGRLLGIIAKQRDLLEIVSKDSFSENIFLWQRTLLGFHFFGINSNNKSLQAKSIGLEGSFSNFLDALIVGLENAYSFFELKNLQAFLKDNRDNHLSIKELIRSCQIFSDFQFRVAQKVIALNAPHLQSLDTVSCILKRAKEIGLVFIRNRRPEFDFNSIGFSIRIDKEQSYNFPYDLILSKEYVLFPMALKIGESNIEYCSVQVIYRFLGVQKEIWFCKEISGLQAGISVDGVFYKIRIMKRNIFKFSKKVVEIYCLSKYDNRFHQIIIRNNRAYMLLSAMESLVLEEGFVLQTKEKKERICILPSPNFLLSEFLDLEYYGKHFTVYTVENRFDSILAKVWESKSGVWRMEVPESFIKFRLQRKNAIDNSRVIIQSVFLIVDSFENVRIMLGDKVLFPRKKQRKIDLSGFNVEEIESMQVHSSIMPILRFEFVQGIEVHSKDNNAIRLV